MGPFASKMYEDQPESSSEDEDQEEIFSTDALTGSSETNPSVVSIPYESLKDVESGLEEYESISLLFLLYNNPIVCLEEMNSFTIGSNFLCRWASSEPHLWQQKLIEALCIIQNFQILRKFGYEKQNLLADYLPFQLSISKHISTYKKTLYRLCESLTNQETEKLLRTVQTNFQSLNLSFRKMKWKYLETYLSHWEIIEFIKPSNVSNLAKIVKVHFEEAYEVLCEYQSVIQKAGSSKTVDNNVNVELPNLEEIRNSPNIEVETVGFNNEDCYHIDPSKPGVCLIINQTFFYNEIKEEYKHLLPKEPHIRLEERIGTEFDRDKLKSTFEKFGFNVIVYNNLPHNVMIEKITETVQSITNESSLFICVLSHGDEGVVYGTNSCRVEISKIQWIMSNKNIKNLGGKPKILILQSCQGQICQPLTPPEELTTDGPTKQVLSTTADMLTFWATVPGFAAIRDIRNGTWFIQTLCKTMLESWKNYHFAEICTRIMRAISKKKWNQNEGPVGMTPIYNSTLLKDLYLPKLKEI